MDKTSAPKTETAGMRDGLKDDAPHLLIIDDDRRIRELTKRYLTENGYRVTVAADAQEARNHLKGLEFDLLVVDVMMPGESGIALTESLSKERDIPVLMLTALGETDNRIRGLEAGADDYLAKPFEPRELLLRINNILKRAAKPEAPAVEQVTFGPFHFAVKKRELKMDGEPVRLTDREQDIMVIFATRAGETVARHELLGDDQDTSERKIDVQINRLRRKIEEDPSDPKWLQTVRGIGYKLSVR
jgi:two-component system, OmpR family, phosphate regulon response regulator OmpR